MSSEQHSTRNPRTQLTPTEGDAMHPTDNPKPGAHPGAQDTERTVTESARAGARPPLDLDQALELNARARQVIAETAPGENPILRTMQRTEARAVVLAAIRDRPGLSGRQLEECLRGTTRRADVRRALRVLVDEGRVATAPGPKRATLYTVADDTHPRSDTQSPTTPPTPGEPVTSAPRPLDGAVTARTAHTTPRLWRRPKPSRPPEPKPARAADSAATPAGFCPSCGRLVSRRHLEVEAPRERRERIEATAQAAHAAAVRDAQQGTAPAFLRPF